jgi:arylsulfatase
VHWPARIQAHGELRTQAGHLIDIMATCVAVAGAKYPEEFNGNQIKPMEGTSLVPAFDNLPIQREAIFWEHEGNRAVRVGQWKLVAKGPAGKWELYDIAKDRSELHDLAEQHPDRVKSMTAQWEAYARRANVLPWIWKPPYGEMNSSEKEVSEARLFDLKPGDDLEGDRRPDIANHALSVTVELAAPGSNGVVLAQGGTVNGFSLYFKDGDLHWAIRRENELQIVTAHAAELANARKLTASLSRDGTPRLSVDGREVATGKGAGLIPRLPADGLQVGRDLKGAVGDYRAPFPYKGEIQSVLLQLE